MNQPSVIVSAQAGCVNSSILEALESAIRNAPIGNARTRRTIAAVKRLTFSALRKGGQGGRVALCCHLVCKLVLSHAEITCLAIRSHIQRVHLSQIMPNESAGCTVSLLRPDSAFRRCIGFDTVQNRPAIISRIVRYAMMQAKITNGAMTTPVVMGSTINQSTNTARCV